MSGPESSFDTSHEPLQLQAVLQRVWKPILDVEIPNGIQVNLDGGWLQSVREVGGEQHKSFLRGWDGAATRMKSLVVCGEVEEGLGT